MVIDWILYSPEAKSAVKHSPAIFLVALTEAGVLMQLRENLVQRGNWVVALQMLEFLLNRFASQLIVLALLQEMAVVARVHAIWEQTL